MRKRWTMLAVALCTTAVALMPATTASAATADPAPEGGVEILGTCGDVFDPSTTGGEAHWTITCGGADVYIDGWVKDTKKDGKCAWVKAFGGSGGSMPHAKACPAGTKTPFEWHTGGTVINAYLYIS
jgi:hypothetical protein